MSFSWTKVNGLRVSESEKNCSASIGRHAQRLNYKRLPNAKDDRWSENNSVGVGGDLFALDGRIQNLPILHKGGEVGGAKP